MDMANRSQILDEAVCANNLGKGVSSILPSDTDKIVGQTALFNLVLANDPEERKLRFQTC